MEMRRIRIGEMLAIDASAIHKGVDGFFWLMGPSITPTERRGSVALVHVRGALEHHAGGQGDSYEGIVSRVTRELGEDAEGGPAGAVVLVIDSPGGVVAGLNETVARLRKLREAAGVPLIAYVNEMAASAAYAIACACDEIICPASAILGSIGTISTMISQAAQDQMLGLDVRLITSGERKADGHPHAPITDAAESAERARVNTLADAFFEIAGKARGISAKKIRGWQAAIFLGTEAEQRGLADDVRGLDETIALVGETADATRAAKGNETDRRASAAGPLDTPADRASVSVAQAGSGRHTESDPMTVKLAALIKSTEAALEKADAKAKPSLQAQLAAYRATQAAMAAEKPEGGDDDEPDDDDDESDATKKAKKAEQSAKKAEAAKHKAKADEHRAKAAEYDEAAKKCMGGDEDDAESEEKKAAASRAAVQALTTSGLSEGAAAALAAQAAMVPALAARLDALEKGGAAKEKSGAIQAALGARRITPAEAKTLAGKDTSFVRDFLEMRPKAIVATEDDALPIPDGQPGAHLGKDVLAAIEEAVAASNATTPVEAKALRESLMAAHIQAATARANGAPTRY